MEVEILKSKYWLCGDCGKSGRELYRGDSKWPTNASLLHMEANPECSVSSSLLCITEGPEYFVIKLENWLLWQVVPHDDRPLPAYCIDLAGWTITVAYHFQTWTYFARSVDPQIKPLHSAMDVNCDHPLPAMLTALRAIGYLK